MILPRIPRHVLLGVFMNKDTEELANKLNKLDSSDKLNEFLEKELDVRAKDFKTYITDIINLKGMTITDLRKRSLIDRTYIYQIMDGRKKPGRDKVVAMCIACNLDLEETQKALMYSGNSELYVKSRRDSIIIFAINNRLNVISTNDLLAKYEEPILQ